jgi:hypothetical protein
VANIRIISVPPGEAPDWVREAWVGVVLPLPAGRLGTRSTRPVAGVLTGPRHFVARLLNLLGGTCRHEDVYVVGVCDAVEALAATRPEAAMWWRDNLPELVRPGRWFAFPAAVCQEQS